MSIDKGFELENILIPKTMNFHVKSLKRAKPLHDSPSRAFAQLFQSITALRDDSGYNDTTAKLSISAARGASAAWALGLY